MSEFIDTLAAQVKAPAMLEHFTRHVHQYMGSPNEFNREKAYVSLDLLEKFLKVAPNEKVESDLETVLLHLKKWDAETPKEIPGATTTNAA